MNEDNYKLLLLVCLLVCLVVVILAIFYNVLLMFTRIWQNRIAKINSIVKVANLLPTISDLNPDNINFLYLLIEAYPVGNPWRGIPFSPLLRWYDYNDKEIATLNVETWHPRYIQTPEGKFTFGSKGAFRISMQLIDFNNREHVIAELDFRQRFIKNTLYIFTISNTNDVLEVEFFPLFYKLVKFYNKPYVTLAEIKKDGKTIGAIRRPKYNIFVRSMVLNYPAPLAVKLFIFYMVAPKYLGSIIGKVKTIKND